MISVVVDMGIRLGWAIEDMDELDGLLELLADEPEIMLRAPRHAITWKWHVET